MGSTGSAIDKSQIERHLGLLFDQACEEHGLWFSIFTLMDRVSRFFQRSTDAVDYCAERAEAGFHVYCCLGMFSQPIEGGSRGTASMVAGIPALWSDVDVVGDAVAHKRKDYPSSIDEALWVANVEPFTPSFYVHSGNGIHPYWLLNEPSVFTREHDNSDTGILVQRWNGTLRMRAKSKGWAIDGTHDLVRVLRVAGTLNWKNKQNPQPVILYEPAEIRRYDLEAMEEVMVAVEYATQSGAYRSMSDVAPFTIDPQASIDKTIIVAAMANSDTFAATWKGERKDLADQSPSAYDFALTNFFVRLGMEDQQIVNALIQWRRERKHEPKLRVDYYQRTIGKVRATTEQETSIARVEDTVNQLPDVDDPSMLTSSDRNRYIEDIRAMLRINVARFIQVRLDQAEYFFELDSGVRFSVGNIRNVTTAHLFRERIAERMGILLDNDDLKKKWYLVTKMLFAIREYEDTVEPTTAAECRSLLVEYLDSSRIYVDEEWSSALRERAPFVRAEVVHINTDSFLTWVRTNRGGEKLSKGDVLRDFRLLNMESVRIEGRDHRNDRKNRTYWTSPVSDWPEIFLHVEPGREGEAMALAGRAKA